ncbi:ABC transporter permease [Formicincola oecophyllae]|uniref:ABC transporter permease n=1 Tax=Formicincola oecophyllae TaxID=2558361 RepID=A0A4Y6U932_9PROT|nr:ABC transporter permease [Formicincola oecophyllae]QDH12891.1 ABC transporter permease [Formicincola oecophyllae]
MPTNPPPTPPGGHHSHHHSWRVWLTYAWRRLRHGLCAEGRHLWGRFLHGVALLGHVVRVQLRFAFLLAGGGWGVIYLGSQPLTWRRSVRFEFWKALRQVTGGGLLSVIVVGAIVGLGVVAQAIFWLGFAGMAKMTGSILARILVREVAPLLVAVIMLGRSGMLTVAQMGTLSTTGKLRVMSGMGVDPFTSFVVPRTGAMTLSCFTLGTIFCGMALGMGYIYCWFKGIVTMPIWSFMFQVAESVQPLDYLGIPLKFLFSGFIVGLSSCLSGLDVTTSDTLSLLLPRGFSRGILSVLLINVLIDISLGLIQGAT